MDPFPGFRSIRRTLDLSGQPTEEFQCLANGTHSVFDTNAGTRWFSALPDNKAIDTAGSIALTFRRRITRRKLRAAHLR